MTSLFKSKIRFIGAIGLMVCVWTTGCKKEGELFEALDPANAGISFENKLTPTDEFNIIDYLYFYNGGGVAIGDINSDSLPDIFLSGNQVKNRLYLNKGNLEFEDITEKAGVAGESSWNTGSVMADVNADGLLDIYVCAVVGFKNLKGKNELYINNGDNTFSERAAEFGLDFESYSSSAAFLDYDSDGDLDMYLLNHAVHTQESFGHARLRNVRTYETGDKLLRNDAGKFVDVSEKANIYGGIIGYGLGVAVSDINSDGCPDIFVGNDFHEDDYLYINNCDGTFREVGRDAFTVMSKFSMGNDISDINHDGHPDIISLDMLADDDRVIKRSESDETVNTLKLRTRDYGYWFQFQRNMLHINNGDGTFTETGLLSNVAATDWSWSALFADFDHDTHQDLFISNGIPKRPNDLDYIKYISSEQLVNTLGKTREVDQKALALMPEGKIRNVIFRGTGDLRFENVSETWLPEEKTCSSATALGDLDNDGDLDIVINNIDSKPGILINQTNSKSNYLKLALTYSKQNPFAIGTRVYCYSKGVQQYKELYTVRGFQASSEPILHFGLGDHPVVDSIRLTWPGGESEVLRNVRVNQTLRLSPTRDARFAVKSTPTQPVFHRVNADSLGLNFQHTEDSYTDFDRLKLIPYQQSDRGPATAVGDLNNDGKDDVFFGGSKRIPGQIYIQGSNSFSTDQLPILKTDSVIEAVDAIIADLNRDGRSDLFVGTGGADFYGKSDPLLDRIYFGGKEGFSLNRVSDLFENASCVRPYDFDNDGDIDIFVGNSSVSNDFGKMPASYLLANNGGRFSPVFNSVFQNLGMVTDATWDDFDKDGRADLVVVGEWMAPVFLKNEGSDFKTQAFTSSELSGLWQSIAPFDINGDGQMDYIVGNWGLNSKFKASARKPMRMYYSDFDENGTTETIVAVERDGEYFPLDNFDLIASQIVSLKKKFLTYESFAGKPIEEIFSDTQLSKAKIHEVSELASGYLLNENGKFRFVRFNDQLQLAPIFAQLAYDFDGDGKREMLLAGNYFGVQPFHGRYGSFNGALVKNENVIRSDRNTGLQFLGQSIRQLNVINMGGRMYLLVTINNGKAQLYTFGK